MKKHYLELLTTVDMMIRQLSWGAIPNLAYSGVLVIGDLHSLRNYFFEMLKVQVAEIRWLAWSTAIKLFDKGIIKLGSFVTPDEIRQDKNMLHELPKMTTNSYTTQRSWDLVDKYNKRFE